jgi:ATP-dependent RNA helicase DDX3X
MAPTRELASQIELEAEKLCFNNPELQPVAVYGGASQRKQLRDLAFAGSNESAAIVVATPGRLTDFVDRNLVSLQAVQYLILDEADRMLDMGFEPQIRKLVLRSGMTPKTQRQTFMFSATFPDKIQLLASEFLRPSYTWIAVGRVGSTTDSITQVLQEATADNRHKLQMVVEAVKAGPKGRTLIFVQKKRTATWLKKQLSKGGPEGWEHNFDPIEAVEIHGDRSQSQREAALAKFRSGECRILVATDVAARGLDIDGVEHVINMDLPVAADDFDSYVHRIGRTGRAGHTGLATSFYVPGDAPKVGNRKIAAKLIQQLKESKQQVPKFLEAECANGDGSSGAKQRFGGTDVRNSGGGRGDRKNKMPQKTSAMQ